MRRGQDRIHAVRDLLRQLVESTLLLAIALQRRQHGIADVQQTAQTPLRNVRGDVLAVRIQNARVGRGVRNGRRAGGRKAGLDRVLLGSDHQRRLSAEQNRRRAIGRERDRDIRNLRKRFQRCVQIGVQSGVRSSVVLNRNIRLLNRRRERIDLAHIGTDLLIYTIGDLRKAAGRRLKALRHGLRLTQNGLRAGGVGRRAPRRKALKQVIERAGQSRLSRNVKQGLNGCQRVRFARKVPLRRELCPHRLVEVLVLRTLRPAELNSAGQARRKVEWLRSSWAICRA